MSEIVRYDQMPETKQAREILYTWFDVTQDPNQTGFIGWEYKKRLIATQMYLQELIDRTPEYSVQAEWIQEQQTLQALKKLDKS
jgi:hypothetical protein